MSETILTPYSHMNNAPIMSARDRVLQTTELLDEILCGLDWRTAVLAQRVSQHWHDVIHSSTAIQYKLGFKKLDRRQHWSLNRNSLGMFISARRIEDDEIQSAGKDNLIATSCRATNVFAQFARLEVGQLYREDYGNEYVFKYDAIPQALLKNDASASWRDMQITQPPTMTINMETIIHFRDALMYRRMPGHQPTLRVRSKDGIKLGQVIDIAKRWTQDSPPEIDWSNERFVLTTVHMIDDDKYLHRLSRASTHCARSEFNCSDAF